MKDNQNYGQVLSAIKKGKKAYREVWPGGTNIEVFRGHCNPETVEGGSIMGIKLSLFDENTENPVRLPIVIQNLPNRRVVQNWQPTSNDQLAEDWIVED